MVVAYFSLGIGCQTLRIISSTFPGARFQGQPRILLQQCKCCSSAWRYGASQRNSRSVPPRHETASKLTTPPPGGECLRDLEPSAAIACSVVGSHARALALMASCVPTCWCAYLLLAVWLYHVEPSVPNERFAHKFVEPCLGNLPITARFDPLRLRSPARLKPGSVIVGKR